jgi:hypothetical protein
MIKVLSDPEHDLESDLMKLMSLNEKNQHSTTYRQ